MSPYDDLGFRICASLDQDDRVTVFAATMLGGAMVALAMSSSRSKAKAEEGSKLRAFYARHKETGEVFGRGLADEAAFGLIDPLISHYSTEEERKAWDDEKARHKAANIAGRGLGFGTSLLYGGEVAKGATTGGKGVALAFSALKSKAISVTGEAAQRAVLKASEEVVVKEALEHGTAQAVAYGARAEEAAVAAAKDAAVATEAGAAKLAAKIKGIAKAGGAKAAMYLDRVVRSEMIEIAAKAAEEAVLKASSGVLSPENAQRAAEIASDAAKSSVDKIVQKIVDSATKEQKESGA